MKHFALYTARTVTAMLLAGTLAGCGVGAIPAATGPTATTEQAARSVPSATTAIAVTTTASAMQTMVSTQTTEPTPTDAPARTTKPTQPPAPTGTPLPASPASEQPMEGHTAAHHATTQAEIKLFMFQPEPLEIQSGTTIVWTNQDDIDHSVTHATPPDAGQAFDSALFGKGMSWSFTFTEPGEYPYFCRRHPSMIGTVRVAGN